MKKELTEFKCEECKKIILIVKGSGFPYHEGWTYIHNLSFKVGFKNSKEILNGSGVSTSTIKDCHFCSDTCMTKYFCNKILDLKKGPFNNLKDMTTILGGIIK